MAIKLIVNYSKKCGLPGYSSHQFSVSAETELVTTGDVAAESGRLYQLLQANVDEQMQATGFVPPGTYGMDPPAETPPNGSPAANGNQPAANGSSAAGANWQRGPAWRCSDKQRDLILRLVDEHQLDKAGVETLAVERFGKGVRQLNRLEASGLIGELLAVHGNTAQDRGAGRPSGSAYHGANGTNGRRDAA